MLINMEVIKQKFTHQKMEGKCNLLKIKGFTWWEKINKLEKKIFSKIKRKFKVYIIEDYKTILITINFIKLLTVNKIPKRKTAFRH